MAKYRLHFSLIELLITISVLSILMTLLIKSLEHTYSMSQTTQCAYQLKQQAQGVHLYKDDHDNVLPTLNVLYYDSYGQLASKNRHIAWKFQISNYVISSDINYADYSKKNSSEGLEGARATHLHEDLISGVFKCPKAEQFESTQGYEYDDIHRSRKGGYGWNFLLQDDRKVTTNQTDTFNLGVVYNLIEKPAETMMIGDTLHPDVNMTFPQVLYHPNRMENKFYNVHNFGINIAWADMHVSLLTDPEVRNNNVDDSYYFRYSK